MWSIKQQKTAECFSFLRKDEMMQAFFSRDKGRVANESLNAGRWGRHWLTEGYPNMELFCTDYQTLVFYLFVSHNSKSLWDLNYIRLSCTRLCLALCFSSRTEIHSTSTSQMGEEVLWKGYDQRSHDHHPRKEKVQLVQIGSGTRSSCHYISGCSHVCSVQGLLCRLAASAASAASAVCSFFSSPSLHIFYAVVQNMLQFYMKFQPKN